MKDISDFTSDQKLPKRLRNKSAIRLKEFRRKELDKTLTEVWHEMGWSGHNRWLRYENGTRDLTLRVVDEIADKYRYNRALLVMFIYQDDYPFFARMVKQHWDTHKKKRSKK